MRRRTLISRALLPFGFALVMLMSGCGSTTNAGAGSGQASMHCTATTVGHGVDTQSANIVCTVTGAPSGDTSFTLSYALARPNGSVFTYDVTCKGTLQNGQGQCAQVVNVIAPASVTDVHVTATLSPSKKVLGPLAPVAAKA
jgi:hypothetical protein